jgi:hypothetical protein
MNITEKGSTLTRSSHENIRRTVEINFGLLGMMPARIEIQQPDHDKGYPPRASLLGIPGELRNVIYELLFPGPNKDTAKLKFLLVCRQIYHETVIPAFASTRFIVRADGNRLADRLRFLSEKQKSLIQIIERPGSSRRGLHFYLAIEEHLRPLCLITETNDAAYLLSAIVRVESLTQVFAYSQNGNSMQRLHNFNFEMRTYSGRAAESLKKLLDVYGNPRMYPLGTAENCIVVNELQLRSKSFALRIKLGAQDRVVTVSVPRYSLCNGNWDTHINGMSP